MVLTESDGWISVDDKYPVSEKPMYWVLFPCGNLIMCRFNNYKQFGGFTNYWQNLSHNDLPMYETSYIEVKQPSPPIKLIDKE